MDAVLARLRLRDRLEQDPEPGVIRRHETDLIIGLVVDLPAQRRGPEARETERIVGIEAERDEPRGHLALHHRSTGSRPRTVHVPSSKRIAAPRAQPRRGHVPRSLVGISTVMRAGVRQRHGAAEPRRRPGEADRTDRE